MHNLCSPIFSLTLIITVSFLPSSTDVGQSKYPSKVLYEDDPTSGEIRCDGNVKSSITIEESGMAAIESDTLEGEWCQRIKQANKERMKLETGNYMQDDTNMRLFDCKETSLPYCVQCTWESLYHLCLGRTLE